MVNVRRNLLWLLVALALPAVVYAATLATPLHVMDDHEIYYLAGMTRATAPRNIVEYTRQDFHENGRFRPLFGLERLGLARAVGPNATLLRLLPYAAVLATTAILFFWGASLGFGPWCSTVAAWLVVLNPTGSESWVLLAAQERMGVLWIALAMLAIVRWAATSRRAWQLTWVLAAVMAALTKESFVLVLPGLMLAAVFADMLLAGHSFRRALVRNAWAAAAVAAVGVAVGIIAAVAVVRNADTYGSYLVSRGRIFHGIVGVIRQAAYSDVLLIPLALFGAAYIHQRWGKPGREDWRKGGREDQNLVPIPSSLPPVLTSSLPPLKSPLVWPPRAAGLLALAVAVWVVPIWGLQAKIGIAGKRWIFPMAIALAAANGLAFWRVRRAAGRAFRLAMDIGIAVWFAYSATACVERVWFFRADALLYQDILAAVDRATGRGGRVLAIPASGMQAEPEVSLRFFLDGMGRSDIAIDRLEIPPDPRQGPYPAALESLWSRYLTEVSSPDMAKYDAILPLPFRGVLKGLDVQQAAQYGEVLRYRRSYFHLRLTGMPVDQIVAEIHVRSSPSPQDR